jgi:hypothetical protein
VFVSAVWWVQCHSRTYWLHGKFASFRPIVATFVRMGSMHHSPWYEQKAEGTRCQGRGKGAGEQKAEGTRCQGRGKGARARKAEGPISSQQRMKGNCATVCCPTQIKQLSSSVPKATLLERPKKPPFPSFETQNKINRTEPVHCRSSHRGN